MPSIHALQRFDVARLGRELKPFKLHWYPTLGSTNSHAARLRREGRLLAPSIVLAGRQTAGRGRGGNAWSSARGSLTATFVLPSHDSLPPQHVPLVAGLAVRDAVAGFGLDQAKIKWPNDIWFDDRKLAGLLCERIGTIDLIGVGLNVSASLAELSRSVRGKAISMSGLMPPPPINEVLIALARHLRESLSDPRTSLAGVLPRLRAVDALAGRRIRVTGTGPVLEGTYEGIDAHGKLRLRCRGKVLALFTGSVTLAGSPYR